MKRTVPEIGTVPTGTVPKKYVSDTNGLLQAGFVFALRRGLLFAEITIGNSIAKKLFIFELNRPIILQSYGI